MDCDGQVYRVQGVGAEIFDQDICRLGVICFCYIVIVIESFQGEFSYIVLEFYYIYIESRKKFYLYNLVIQFFVKN